MRDYQLFSGVKHSDTLTERMKRFRNLTVVCSSAGAGWGVGTSLDKMITMQAQMEHFATSLEGMHDTVTTCQVVLSQLVDGESFLFFTSINEERCISIMGMGCIFFQASLLCAHDMQLPNTSMSITTSRSMCYILNFFLYSISSPTGTDQVKQYQKIHELRRAVAGKNTGGSAPGDYFFEFSCGRGGTSLGSNFPSVSTDPDSALASDTSMNTAHTLEKVNGVGSSIASSDDTGLRAQSSSEKAEPTVAEDIKIEVGDMLEHSSGAALYERLLCSGCFASVIDEDEDKVSSEEAQQPTGTCMGVFQPTDITADVDSGKSTHEVDLVAKQSLADSAVDSKASEAFKAADSLREMKELLASRYRAKTLEDKQRANVAPDGS